MACTVQASIGITDYYYDYLSMATNASLLDTLVRIAKDKSEGEARMWSIQAISHFARSPPVAPYLLASNILPTMMEVVRKAGTDLSRWRGNACEFWALSFLMNIAQANAASKGSRASPVARTRCQLSCPFRNPASDCDDGLGDMRDYAPITINLKFHLMHI